MAKMWNEFDLKMPPLTTLTIKHAEFVPSLRSQLIDALEFYESQTELAEAAALLSRLIARRKNSFAKMNGFKIICKLNSALCRLLRLDIQEILRNFLGIVPEYILPNKANSVPLRANFEYVLVRLIALHKILQRVSECCVQAADYFTKLLANNFFVDILTLMLATIAKIWKLSNGIGNRTVDVYAKLLKFTDNFPKGKTDFITDFVLPSKLQRLSKKTSNSSDSTDKFGSSKIKLERNEVKRTQQPITEIASSDLIDMNEQHTLEPIAFDFCEIQSVKDIQKFFKEEDKKRKHLSERCVTEHIPFQEWSALKKIVGKKIISNDHKKAISTFKDLLSDKLRSKSKK